MNVNEYLSTVPPSCLSGLRPQAGPDAGWWVLRCVCGCVEGAVLGYPLGELKTDVDEEYAGWLVSPLSFRCGKCGRVTPFLDTAIHGEGGAWGHGCSAYRGEGEPMPAACPRCQATQAGVHVILGYHEERIQDFGDDPNFALAEYFDGVLVQCACEGCGHVWGVTNLDTK